MFSNYVAAMRHAAYEIINDTGTFRTCTVSGPSAEP